MESDKESFPWPLVLFGILGIASWFRSKSETPNEQSVKPVPAQDNTDRKSGNSKNKNNVSTGAIASIQIPVTKTENNNSEKRSYRIRRLRKAGKDMISVLTLLAVVAYATISRNQWKAMTDALGEARKQTVIDQQQLEATTRPWIAVDFAIDGPVTFDADGARLRFAIQATNVGNSPALNLIINPKVMNENPGKPEQIQLDCAKEMVLPNYVIKGNLSTWGDTVFKGRPVLKRFALAIPKAELNRTFTSFPKGTIMPHIVGCVNYTIVPSGDYHHTFFSYSLLRISQRGQSPFFMNGVDVPQNQLKFTIDHAFPAN